MAVDHGTLGCLKGVLFKDPEKTRAKTIKFHGLFFTLHELIGNSSSLTVVRAAIIIHRLSSQPPLHTGNPVLSSREE